MNQQDLYAMRHSLAHITATAVQHLWPNVKLGVGPVVEDGFYYDVDLGAESISEEDFSKIEAEMRKIISKNQPFERFTMPIDEAIGWAHNHNQPYKVELLNDLKREGTTVAKDLDSAELGLATDDQSKVEDVSFYRNGDFCDLCRGPHVESTGKVGAFKLMRVAGAYWRGKESNPQMQRLYGVAFATKEELDTYLMALEEAKRRDHRLLGKQLDLFTISELVGPGLPLFTPRGTVLRNLLIRFSEEMQCNRGYEAVWAPHITRIALYKTSGHYDKYPERFTVTSTESDDEFMMKPMNCPHVTQIYASRPRSYRDLPLRFMETTTMYRDEKSGELHGLSRVRALTQDDAHVFCRKDQIEEEVTRVVDMIKEMYQTLDLELSFVLSFRDGSDKYLGSAEVWDLAQTTIKQLAEGSGVPFTIQEGEAAFYGPKIDIMIKDSLGREWQCATVQIDFVQPERFGLSYTNSNGDPERPVMIHKALLGSIERFLSVYIEHTAGWFPFWLAPEQVRILTVNDAAKEYADEVARTIKDLVLMKPCKYNELRFTLDERNESLGRKIRDAVEFKIPVIIVVGMRDAEKRQVVVRTRNNEESISLDSLKEYLMNL
jgi:threonyl-tRNA synthetase